MPCTAFPVPSWRSVQILTLLSVALCLSVLYTAPWGRPEARLPSALTHLLPGDQGAHLTTASEGASNNLIDGADAGTQHDATSQESAPQQSEKEHPITRLIRAAQSQFDALLSEHPVSVIDAGRKYRARRGRHPPPGFDVWYGFAERKGAVVPEVFFDQVHGDLGPFWGVDVRALRRAVRGFSPRVRVRNGSVEVGVGGENERVRGVVEMLGEMAREGGEVPDVDLPVNGNGEVGMLVPWETMETAVEFARAFAPGRGVVETFSPGEEDGGEEEVFDPEWLGDGLRHKAGGPHLGPRPLWSLVRPACPPGSVARNAEVMTDIWHPEGHTKSEHGVAALLPFNPPVNSSDGYISNWTVAGDVCNRPELQGLHGTFVAPTAMSVTRKLFPLFSTAKMGVSNEILIPAMADNKSNDLVSVRAWREKETKLHWCGSASGGQNSRQNWRRMHRHRFVSMLNATHVEVAEGMLHAGNETTVGLGYAQNFRLLPGNGYHLETQRGARMAEWVAGWADAGFTDLRCDEPTEAVDCEYNDEFFSILFDADALEEDRYKYTAVIDGDGAEEHGNLTKHLLHGNVVLRASVYKQWFDARVIPWLHFVPLDHMYVDLYGIMEYFIGTSISSPVPEFQHAHVEVEEHEHHFQTPQWDGADKKDVHRSSSEHADHRKTFSTTRDASIGHDAQAQRIAEAGQQWAKKALRKEDMLVYFYRLLLEYARVVDERRHTLGWVGYLAEEAA